MADFDYRKWLDKKQRDHEASATQGSNEKALRFIAITHATQIGYTLVGKWVGLSEVEVRKLFVNRGCIPDEILTLLDEIAERIATIRSIDPRPQPSPFDAAATARGMIEQDMQAAGDRFSHIAPPLWFWRVAYGEGEGLRLALQHAHPDDLPQIRREASMGATPQASSVHTGRSGSVGVGEAPAAHLVDNPRPPRTVMHRGVECDVTDEGMFFDFTVLRERPWQEAGQ